MERIVVYSPSCQKEQRREENAVENETSVSFKLQELVTNIFLFPSLPRVQKNIEQGMD